MTTVTPHGLCIHSRYPLSIVCSSWVSVVTVYFSSIHVQQGLLLAANDTNSQTGGVDDMRD